ncbi:MAG: hypothetical protein IT449_13275 [Phycisphaerales bacterium]|nr:hypothetical protein [Phycisphaerales bacterium]
MRKHPILISGLISLLAATTAWAQPAESMPYPMASGELKNPNDEMMVVPIGVVTVAGAPWLQIHVGAFDLGEGSYILFRSVEDGYWLRHNDETLAQWNGWSAFFNGDAVEVELHVAPWAEHVFADVDAVLVGIRSPGGEADPGADVDGDNSAPADVCSEDLRSPSTAKRVGRGIDPNAGSAGCTNWIIANGALLTAGHCAVSSKPYVEFDIPASDCDGTVNFGSPDHQYAVDLSSFDCSTGDNCENAGQGADWNVRAVFPNPNTHLMPAYGEGAFARLARDLDVLDPTTVRLTGCGVDDVPTGCTGNNNSDNQTRQTSTGDFDLEDSSGSSIWIEYDIYGRNGLSGAPVFDVANNVGIGIHTNSTEGGSCPSSATSFNHNSLQLAINSFPGPNAVYVDSGHPITSETGKIFRPYLTLDHGLAHVPSGGILSVATGTYASSSTVIKQSVVIQAPVGSVLVTH